MFKVSVSLVKKVQLSFFVVFLASLLLAVPASAQVTDEDEGDEGLHGIYPACPAETPFYNHETKSCEVLLTESYCKNQGLELWGYKNVCREPSCDDGYSWNGNRCVQNTPTCPANSSWNGSECISNIPTCPSGSSWNGSACVSIPPECPANSSWNGSECICNKGFFTNQAGECVGGL